jgi:uncharacterized protein with beta-barrel porin domain
MSQASTPRLAGAGRSAGSRFAAKGPWPAAVACAGVAMGAAAWGGGPVLADQQFRFATASSLDSICSDPGGNDLIAGSALEGYCNSLTSGPPGFFPNPTATAADNGVSSFTQSNTARAVGERLRSVRGVGGMPFAGDGTEVASTEAAAGSIDFGRGVSAFVSAGFEGMDHDSNDFEDAYDAFLPGVTVGADIQVNDWLVAGLAFGYQHADADYDTGGGFDSDAYGPILYFGLLPYENTFVQLSLGYQRQNTDRERISRAVDGSGAVLASGAEQAEFDTDRYSADALVGYDHPIDGFTIGPRLGLAYAYWDTGSFQESGSTGLELRYESYDQDSLQTSLGVAVGTAISTSFGVLVPQASVAWVHEFLDDGRGVVAQYVDAPGSTPFSFDREETARDWAVISVGVSAQLAHRLQPFVNFSTVQGNENFTSYRGTIGLRMDF